MALDLTQDAAVYLSDFGEAVVYRPRAGQPRPIRALVDRSPPAPVAEAPGALAPRIRLVVRNDDRLGVSSREVDTGGDRVEVAVRLGRAPESLAVVRVAAQDAGLVELEAR